MTSYQPADGRYDTMRYRRVGRSGLLLPAISLGLTLDDPDAVAEIWHRWMLELKADEDLGFDEEPSG